jgi:hypothetical protein
MFAKLDGVTITVKPSTEGDKFWVRRTSPYYNEVAATEPGIYGWEKFVAEANAAMPKLISLDEDAYVFSYIFVFEIDEECSLDGPRALAFAKRVDEYRDQAVAFIRKHLKEG